MRIAVYTLTRDRLDYTKLAFQSLKRMAGYPYDHYVVDNGSQDGTVEWLRGWPLKHLITMPENIGISRGSNLALDTLLKDPYDLIVKFDNDCLVESTNILQQFVSMQQDVEAHRFGPLFVWSPYVKGINHQPNRVRYTMRAGMKIGLTSIVGGLFHVVPRAVYKDYRYPENLPLAKGQDDHFCAWVRRHGGEVGYVEGLSVQHMDGTDGQVKKYPDYFERKWREEQQIAASAR